MCILCVDIIKQKLTRKEIVKNYTEIVFTDDRDKKHEEEVFENIKKHYDEALIQEVTEAILSRVIQERTDNGRP